jgi:hypothetical protein
MRRLAMRFHGILRGKHRTLDVWIDDAIDSKLIPIMRFARVLQRYRSRQQRYRAALAATDKPKTRSTASRPSSA